MEKFKIGMDPRKVVTAANMNEISDAVNWTKENKERLSGRGARGEYYQNGEIRIQYSGGAPLEQFSAVALTGLVLTPTNCDDFSFTVPTFTAALVTTANADLPFAICKKPANSGELTKAVLAGVTPAQVTIKDSMHQYAKPTPGSSTGALESCEAGTTRIVWKAGNSGAQWCIIQIGAGGAESYNGPFALSLDENMKISCEAGYLNRNGEIVNVAAKTGIVPANGYVCVYSNVSGQSWTTPEIKIVSSLSAGYYPVGFCEMRGTVPVLTSYRVAMAIIMITGSCPVNATT